MQVTVRLTGKTPLVLHNNQCVDPRNPLKKAISAITSKGKRKTDADLEEIIRLEFAAGLYLDPVLGPVVPAQNIRKMLIEAARKDKNGKQFESGAYIYEASAIEYEGPRDLRGMIDDGRFMWTTVVGNQSASILRTRPKFDQWALNFNVELEDTLVTKDMLQNAMNHAQLAVGLCDARAIGYGRFSWEIVG